jgi:hypothetical protein
MSAFRVCRSVRLQGIRSPAKAGHYVLQAGGAISLSVLFRNGADAQGGWALSSSSETDEEIRRIYVYIGLRSLSAIHPRTIR